MQFVQEDIIFSTHRFLISWITMTVKIKKLRYKSRETVGYVLRRLESPLFQLILPIFKIKVNSEQS